MSEYDHNDKAGNEGDLVKHFVLTYAIEAWLKKVNEAITNNNQNIEVNYFDVFSANAENRVSIKNGAWKNGVGLIPSLENFEKTTLLWQQIYQMWGLKSNLDTKKEETKPSCRNYPGSSVFANQVFGINKGKIKKINIFANDILPECAQNQNAYFAFYNKDGRGMHFDECRFTASISDWKDFLGLHFSSSPKKDYARDFVVIDPPNLNTIVDLFNKNGLIEPKTKDPADRAKWNLNDSNIFIWIPIIKNYDKKQKSFSDPANLDKFHNKAIEKKFLCLEFIYGGYRIRSTSGCRIYLKLNSSSTSQESEEDSSINLTKNVLFKAKRKLEEVIGVAINEAQRSIKEQKPADNPLGIIEGQLKELKKDLEKNFNDNGSLLQMCNEVFDYIEKKKELLLIFFTNGLNRDEAYSFLGQEFFKVNNKLFPIAGKKGAKPVRIFKKYLQEIQGKLKLEPKEETKTAYELLQTLKGFKLEITCPPKTVPLDGLSFTLSE
jgi:hypothetical protein